jgi:NADP-dependent 3-hydroxy acid dehydrogenase YdfG
MSAAAGGPLAARTALVTGASRGIGAAVARALAAQGARVALAARSADALSALARELGPGHLAVTADLTVSRDIAALAARVTEWAPGAPDILVNNAGIFPRAAAHEQDPDDFARTLELNLAAPFRVLRAFLPRMLSRRRGDVVTLGSVADRHAYAENAAYSASKFGARGLHEVLRAETRGTGVRATLIAPGPVDTAIWAAYEPALGKTLMARGSMLRPDDVARAVLFAVSQPPHVDIEELRLSPA